MRTVLSSTLALLVGMGAALAFPTAEVPTSEAAYVAKVKTAAPEEIVAKATIVMTQDGKERSLQTGWIVLQQANCKPNYLRSKVPRVFNSSADTSETAHDAIPACDQWRMLYPSRVSEVGAASGPPLDGHMKTLMVCRRR